MIGYFDCVRFVFEFLRSEHVRSSSLKSVNAIEIPKSYRTNADEMLFKTLCAKKRMILVPYAKKTHTKNQMLQKCKHDLSSNTEKVMKYKKN